MQKLLAVCLILTLTACGYTVYSRSAYELLDASVAVYCAKDESARLFIRESVAAKVEPNRITIECADPGE